MRCLPGSADAAQIVELRIHAVADDAAVARQRRRLVDQRAVELVAQIGAGRRARRPGSARAAPGTRRAACGRAARPRATGEARRDRAGPAVPSAARATSRSTSWTRLQRVAQLGALGARGTRSPRPRRADPGSARATTQRPKQPGAQQAPAHRRDRAIDFVQQRSGAAAVRRLRSTSRFRSVVGSMTRQSAPVRNAIVAHVREVGLLRVAQVLDEGAGGREVAAGRSSRPNPCSVCVCSWSISVAAPPRIRTSSRRPASAARRAAMPRSASAAASSNAGRREHFARPQHRELVGERLASRPARRTPPP